MNTSHDLTKEQWEQLRDTVAEMKGYLYRVSRRIDDLRFPQVDPLWGKVAKAYDGVFSLWIHCHYASCSGAVGDSFRRK
jgi:hypothetical protein